MRPSRFFFIFVFFRCKRSIRVLLFRALLGRNASRHPKGVGNLKSPELGFSGQQENKNHLLLAGGGVFSTVVEISVENLSRLSEIVQFQVPFRLG